MSTWINLDAWKSLDTSHGRTKRGHQNMFHQKTPIIEYDNSQENFINDKSLSAPRRRITKRRRMESLNITISNRRGSSDESVEYDPDGTKPFMNELKTTVKPTLRLLPTKTSSPETSSANCPKDPSKSHFNNWSVLQKSFGENITLSDSIVECSDSDESESNASPKIESTNASTLLDSMIEDCSSDSSQMPSLTTALESIIETEDSMTPPADHNFQIIKLPKKRSVRFVKGGMVERLNKCLSRAKSNLLYWQHHRSANLIPPGIHVRVERVEKTYGRKILHTNINDMPTMLCLYPNTPQCKEDDVIEVEFDRRRKHKIDNGIMYLFVDKISHTK